MIYEGFTDQEVVDAMVKASHDRDFLAKLRDLGKVRRDDGVYETRHPDVAKPFVADIERRRARSKVNLAIRPNKKRRKR